MQASGSRRVRASIEICGDPPVLMSKELAGALIGAGMLIEEDVRIDMAELMQADLDAKPALGEALDKTTQGRCWLGIAFSAIEEELRLFSKVRLEDLVLVPSNKRGCFRREHCSKWVSVFDHLARQFNQALLVISVCQDQGLVKCQSGDVGRPETDEQPDADRNASLCLRQRKSRNRLPFCFRKQLIRKIDQCREGNRIFEPLEQVTVLLGETRSDVLDPLERLFQLSHNSIAGFNPLLCDEDESFR